MKKSVLILSVAMVAALLLTSCATIETRYIGKRIPAGPAEYEYRDHDSHDYYPYEYYYDPYYSAYCGPSVAIGFSFWNPFWYYGVVGSYCWGYSPYYYGYYPYYWGYYPYYWGGGYYPNYPGYGYSPYRTTYKTYIRKDQLSKGRSYRSPTVRTKSTVKRSGSSTAIRSRSMTPTRSRTTSTATRTRTTSRSGSVKRKK